LRGYLSSCYEDHDGKKRKEILAKNDDFIK
jgi:hypothetical protein